MHFVSHLHRGLLCLVFRVDTEKTLKRKGIFGAFMPPKLSKGFRPQLVTKRLTPREAERDVQVGALHIYALQQAHNVIGLSSNLFIDILILFIKLSQLKTKPVLKHVRA